MSKYTIDLQENLNLYQPGLKALLDKVVKAQLTAMIKPIVDEYADEVAARLSSKLLAVHEDYQTGTKRYMITLEEKAK